MSGDWTPKGMGDLFGLGQLLGVTQGPGLAGVLAGQAVGPGAQQQQISDQYRQGLLAGHAAQAQPSQQQMDLLRQLLGGTAAGVQTLVPVPTRAEPPPPPPPRAPVETDIGAVAAKRKITK